MTFKWIGAPEKAYYVPTEDPVYEIWHELSFILKYNKFLKKHNSSFTDDRLNFIIGSFTQALEYKEAANRSTDHTRPLLLYYCFMNLVKAVLYTIEDEAVNPYHGLKKPIIDRDNLLNSEVSVDEGVFYSLAKSTNTILERDSKIRISEVLSRIVEMKKTYEMYYELQSNVIWLDPKISSEGAFSFTINKQQVKTIDDFAAKWENYLPILKDKFSLIDDTDLGFRFSFKDKYFEEVKKKSVSRPDIDEFIKSTGSELFMRDKSSGLFRAHMIIYSREYAWPQVMFYYAMLYFLSMIVRYDPDIWYENVIDKEKGEIWVISKFCKLAERVMPNLLLDLLYGMNFVYTSYAGIL